MWAWTRFLKKEFHQNFIYSTDFLEFLHENIGFYKFDLQATCLRSFYSS